jgi:hypothetical protein
MSEFVAAGGRRQQHRRLCEIIATLGGEGLTRSGPRRNDADRDVRRVDSFMFWGLGEARLRAAFLAAVLAVGLCLAKRKIRDAEKRCGLADLLP